MKHVRILPLLVALLILTQTASEARPTFRGVVGGSYLLARNIVHKGYVAIAIPVLIVNAGIIGGALIVDNCVLRWLLSEND